MKNYKLITLNPYLLLFFILSGIVGFATLFVGYKVGSFVLVGDFLNATERFLQLEPGSKGMNIVMGVYVLLFSVLYMEICNLVFGFRNEFTITEQGISGKWIWRGNNKLSSWKHQEKTLTWPEIDSYIYGSNVGGKFGVGLRVFTRSGERYTFYCIASLFKPRAYKLLVEDFEAQCDIYRSNDQSVSATS